MYVPVVQLDRVCGYEPNTLPTTGNLNFIYAPVAQLDRVLGYEPYTLPTVGS